MGRRSPTNPRYGKDAKVGSTRRSASSLKPKREAGETGSKPVPKAKPKSDAKKARPSMSEIMPTSPEIKKWRTIWYALLAIMIASWLVEMYWPGLRTNQTAQVVGLSITSGAFLAAMYIELVKIRSLRKALIEEQKAAKKKGKS